MLLSLFLFLSHFLATPDLGQSLNFIGYPKEQHEALVQIFYMSGTLYGKEEKSPLTKRQVSELLRSKLGLPGNPSVQEIAAEFNRLGQKKFQQMRGLGERDGIHPIPVPGKKFLHFVNRLGIMKEVLPKKDADLYVIFGASESTLKNRISFIQENVKHLGNKKFIFLGGDRKMWPGYTGKDQELSKLIISEDSTFKLIKELNPTVNINTIIDKVNSFYLSKKNDIISGKVKVHELRNQIVLSILPDIRWPTESDLERLFARKMLKIENPIIIEGDIDPKIGRPTTYTTIKKISKLKIIESQPVTYFVSSAPYIRRQTDLAKMYSKLDHVYGCGRGKSFNKDDISLVLEATIGQVYGLYKMAVEREQEDRLVHAYNMDNQYLNNFTSAFPVIA